MHTVTLSDKVYGIIPWQPEFARADRVGAFKVNFIRQAEGLEGTTWAFCIIGQRSGPVAI